MKDHVPPHLPRPSSLEGEVSALNQMVSQAVKRLGDCKQHDGEQLAGSSVVKPEYAERVEEQGRVLEIQTSEELTRNKDDASVSESSGVKTPDTSEGEAMEETGNIAEVVIADEEEVQLEQNQRLIARHDNFSTQYLQNLLKKLRQKLDIYYETRKWGIPSPLIAGLAAFESTFDLLRDPTTSSIWNLLHQEQRFVTFTTEEVGILYKQKCECNKGIPHTNDIHCPRNIVDESTETDGDTDSTSDEEPELTAEQVAERDATAKKELQEKMAAKAEEARGDMEAMVGLAELKSHASKLANRVETAKRQGVDIKEERFGTMFIGAPGTGKTTAAKHYARYLHALGVVSSDTVKETTAIYLSDGGIDRTMRYISQIENSGGVFFIDGAHNFVNRNHSRGRKVLDYILEEIERTKGKMVFLLAGHEEGMRDILGAGSDVAGLLPNVVKFGDMEDEELRKVLCGYLKKKGGEKIVVEGGEEGLYMRIAARRIGRGRGASGFGNARAVENTCAKIWERQATRLGEVRKIAREKKEAEEKEEKEMEEKEKEKKENENKEAEVEKHESAKTNVQEGEIIAMELVPASVETVSEIMDEKPEAETANMEAEPIVHTPVESPEQTAQSQKGGEPTPIIEAKDSELNIGDSNTGEVTDKDTQISGSKNEDLNNGGSEGSNIKEGDAKDGDMKDGNLKDSDAQKEGNKDAEVPGIDTPKDDKAAEPDFDPEDYLLTKEDILGPDPGTAALSSPAWKKLQSLTGMTYVKESILSLLSLVQTNYIRELQEKPLLKVSLNRLFLGPPGTGKTLVAKLYAQLLTEIGALSKGEVIIKTPSDLIGKYIGHSEANTKAALTAAMGNVLVIDEAYMMYGSAADKTGSKSDSFRQGIMDTLVGEIQSEPGEDRCVLLLGYEEPMQEMLQNSNPGLARRFPISDAFWFQNFTAEELESILRSKLKESVLEASEEAIKVGMEVLEKARSRVNFGNGGEVENLISKAKINYQKRISAVPIAERPEQWIFEPQDFDPAFDRVKSAPENLRELFSDVVGCEDIIEKLGRYQRVCQTLKKRNMDPRDFIPTNFVFKGPPGTGKTTTARKIAQIYYDMGFLAEPSVVECSASDLVGKYVGHSGPKTRKVFERGLGKVLFIDEAYRLAGGGGASCGSGSFNAEVVAELVDLLTKPDFNGKLIVILAGYEKEMNQLLAMNPGLASRFPEEIHFSSLDPVKCLEILKMKLEKTGVTTKVLDQRDGQMFENLISLLNFLAKTPGWGSARDMETLAKSLARDIFAGFEGEDEELVCEGEQIAAAMDVMLQERRARRSVR